MWVRSLVQKEALEEGKATPSNILAQRISWTEEPGGLPSWTLLKQLSIMHEPFLIPPQLLVHHSLYYQLILLTSS